MAETTCGICGFDAEDEDELEIHLEDCEAVLDELLDDEVGGHERGDRG